MSALALKQTSAREAMSRLSSLDLSMVKLKLMDKDEGQGWTKEYTDYVETRYQRYLCMLLLYPELSIVPTQEIDLFWHQHILDTRAYAADCERTFGYFVHHFPYFGMRDENDAKDLLDSFEETKSIYLSLFEEEYCLEFAGGKASMASKCHKSCSKCHKCKSGCSGISCRQCRSK